MKTLGMRGVLICAVYDHMKHFQGELPKKFILHPALRVSLMLELKPYEHLGFGETEKFNGIEIEWSIQATRAKLVNCQNVIEYL